MTVSLADLMASVESHQEAAGLFEVVTRHEPKSRPGPGITAANWFASVRPLPSGSGLQQTTARIELTTRFYTDMLAEPADDIDPIIYEAVDLMIAAYSADFTLDGTVRQIDLLGGFGEPLQGRAGYLNQSGGMYRVFDLLIPLIVNDAWPQIP